MSEQKDYKLFASAKVHFNEKQFLKAIQCLTSALTYKQDFNYYLRRSECYFSIGSDNALELSSNDCLNAKQINICCDWFQMRHKINECLLSFDSQIKDSKMGLLSKTQELAEQIEVLKRSLNEDSLESKSLIDLYLERALNYDTFGTIEAKELSQTDVKKVIKVGKKLGKSNHFMIERMQIASQKVEEYCDECKPLQRWDTLEIVKTCEEYKPNNNNNSVEECDDISVDEVYYSDDDI